MVRRPKPESEIHPHTKKMRAFYKQNPVEHEKYKQKMKVQYQKNREQIRMRKKQKMKEQKEYVYNLLGSKCASCGEPYNPHIKRSNLEIDHKFYFPDEFFGLGTILRILRIEKQGIDPNIQYNLLCHTCHMVVTSIRKNQVKGKAVLKFLKNTNVLKEEPK